MQLPCYHAALIRILCEGIYPVAFHYPVTFLVEILLVGKSFMCNFKWQYANKYLSLREHAVLHP